MLNPVWLNTYMTLIEVGHFTLTAEKLFMTQPGVSQHIKKLEHSCGQTLITREGKRFEMTEQGRLVYEYAQTLAAQDKQLMDKLRFDDPYAGKCHISCSGSLATRLFPRLLDLQVEHCNLSIHVEAAPNNRILEGIQNGDIDLGIVTDLPSSTLFTVEKIGDEPLCLVLPSRYRGTEITQNLLQELGLASHPDAKHYLSLYLEEFGHSELQGFDIEKLKIVSYVNQISQILLPVAKGIGFTVLPQSAITSMGLEDDILIHSTQNLVSESLYLVRKKHRTLPSRYKTIEREMFKILK